MRRKYCDRSIALWCDFSQCHGPAAWRQEETNHIIIIIMVVSTTGARADYVQDHRRDSKVGEDAGTPVGLGTPHNMVGPYYQASMLQLIATVMGGGCADTQVYGCRPSSLNATAVAAFAASTCTYLAPAAGSRIRGSGYHYIWAHSGRLSCMASGGPIARRLWQVKTKARRSIKK